MNNFGNRPSFGASDGLVPPTGHGLLFSVGHHLLLRVRHRPAVHQRQPLPPRILSRRLADDVNSNNNNYNNTTCYVMETTK